MNPLSHPVKLPIKILFPDISIGPHNFMGIVRGSPFDCPILYSYRHSKTSNRLNLVTFPYDELHKDSKKVFVQFWILEDFNLLFHIINKNTLKYHYLKIGVYHYLKIGLLFHIVDFAMRIQASETFPNSCFD